MNKNGKELKRWGRVSPRSNVSLTLNPIGTLSIPQLPIRLLPESEFPRDCFQRNYSTFVRRAIKAGRYWFVSFVGVLALLLLLPGSQTARSKEPHSQYLVYVGTRGEHDVGIYGIPLQRGHRKVNPTRICGGDCESFLSGCQPGRSQSLRGQHYQQF